MMKAFLSRVLVRLFPPRPKQIEWKGPGWYGFNRRDYGFYEFIHNDETTDWEDLHWFWEIPEGWVDKPKIIKHRPER